MTDNPDDDALQGAHLDTLAVRAGIARTLEGEHAEPIFLTSSYVFDSAADAAARFAGNAPGNVLALHQSHGACVRAADRRARRRRAGGGHRLRHGGYSQHLHGAAQERRSCRNSRNVFGTTVNLFSKYPAKFGVEVSFVPLLAIDAWRAAIRPNTAMLFPETPPIRCARWPISRPCPTPGKGQRLPAGGG